MDTNQYDLETVNNPIKPDIVLWSSFDPDKIVYSQIRDNKNGQGRSVPFLYNGHKLHLKSPTMLAPFGPTHPAKSETKIPQWSMQLSMPGEGFEEKCVCYDEHLIDKATKNSEQWFGKEVSKEVITDRLFRMVKGSNGKFPNYIRVRIPTFKTNEKEFDCEFYDPQFRTIPDVSPDPTSSRCITNIIPRQSRCRVLLKADAVWCSSNGFGTTWRACQIVVYPPEGLPKGICQINDPLSDEEVEQYEE